MPASDRRPSDKVTLKITYALCTEQHSVRGFLDAFGDCTEPEILGETDQMTQHVSLLPVASECTHNGTVNLHNIERQHFEMAQRSVSRAEIVKSNAATYPAQHIDEVCRISDIPDRCGFRDIPIRLKQVPQLLREGA